MGLKKTFSRTLSFVLVMLLLLSLFPGFALATSSYSLSGVNGLEITTNDDNDAIIWRIISIESDGTLKIMRWFNGYPEIYWDENGNSDWGNSTLKGILNDIDNSYYNFLSSTSKEQIAYHNFNVGSVTTENAANLITTVNEEKSDIWTGNIGLLNVSDVIKGDSDIQNCGTLSDYGVNQLCDGHSNYLGYDNYDFWLINPKRSGWAWITTRSYKKSPLTEFLEERVNDFSARWRPVVFLKVGTELSGSGTSSNPYVIVKNGTSNGNSSAEQSDRQTVYAINENQITKNSSTLQDIETTYNSCAATGKNVCLKYTIENNIVTGAEACFIKDGTEYCLTGWHDELSSATTPIYDANLSTLQTAFTEGNACTDGGSFYDCYASGLSAGASSNGGVVAGGDSWGCTVDSDGWAHC